MVRGASRWLPWSHSDRPEQGLSDTTPARRQRVVVDVAPRSTGGFGRTVTRGCVASGHPFARLLMEDASAPRALPVLQIRILGDRRESPAASEGPDLGRARNLKSTEEHYVLAMVSGEDERDSGPLGPRYLITVLAVMAVVWVVLFVVRVQAHQPNVDDYLYAYTAKSLYVSGDPFSAFLHTGQTSPLVPAMAALGADVRGIYGALAVELPLVLLLVAGNFVLPGYGCPPWPPWWSRSWPGSTSKS